MNTQDKTNNFNGEILQGRIIAKYNKFVRVACDSTDILATIAGKTVPIRQSPSEGTVGRELSDKKRSTKNKGAGSSTTETEPVTGDEVFVELFDRNAENAARNLDAKNADLPRGIIRAVLPRKTVFSRKVAGEETREQVIAANIDLILIIVGLDQNFSIPRIERYLTAAWESGAEPVIVLNKVDLLPVEETIRKTAEVEQVAIGIRILLTSTITGDGLDELIALLHDNRSAVIIGSSGVGKSSIINMIEGNPIQKVQQTREQDGKGRHTTTLSRLITLPNGGSIIDTPGMRELQVWSSESSLEAAFEDIENIAAQCRFTNCNHTGEPGCAVRDALDRGVITEKRFRSFCKLKKEIEFLERRKDENYQQLERQRSKRFTKNAKQIIRHKPRYR